MGNQNPKHFVDAVAKVMGVIPGLAPLGSVLTTLSPLVFKDSDPHADILRELKSIDANLALYQRQTLGKLEDLETLMRDNNCQGSIKKQMDLINHSWDALIGITAAEKVSPELGQAQRDHFASICSNGADCLLATKGLLEIIANYDGTE